LIPLIHLSPLPVQEMAATMGELVERPALAPIAAVAAAEEEVAVAQAAEIMESALARFASPAAQPAVGAHISPG
jgi:hypothetical protein